MAAAIREQGATPSPTRRTWPTRARWRPWPPPPSGTWAFVEVLVNNAGIAWKGLLTDMTLAEWRRVLDVNCTGAFLCCRAFLPAMIREKRGSIVNISSMWGQQGASCEAAYSASKAALIGLTQALAQEEGPSGIRVNCVAPGVIDTPMNAGLSPADLAALREETPCSARHPETGWPRLFCAWRNRNSSPGRYWG